MAVVRRGVGAARRARRTGPRLPRDAQPPVEEAARGIPRCCAREPAARLLVGLLGAQFVAIGALDVLYVVLAISVLGLGRLGAGYLNAAFGAGGVAGIAVTPVARRPAPAAAPGRRSASLRASAASRSSRLWPSALAALLLLAVAGAARSLLDVAGRTLLQRTAPADVLARVFGVLEGLSMAGARASARC